MKLRNNILWIGCLTIAAQACALTLGPTQGPVVLGAPMDIRVTVEPDAGQTLHSSCIDANAQLGEVLAHLSLDLLPPNTVRIHSRQAVNEPLVSLKISAGCNNKAVRSYTLFADPPKALSSAPASNAQTPIRLTPPNHTASPAPAAQPRATATAAAAPAQTPPAAAPHPAKSAPPPAPSPARTAAASAAASTDAAATRPSATPISPEAMDNMRPVLRMDTLFLFPDSSEARANTESPAANRATAHHLGAAAKARSHSACAPKRAAGCSANTATDLGAVSVAGAAADGLGRHCAAA